MKDTAEDAVPKQKRTDLTKEPMTLFGCSEDVYTELIHRTNAAGVIQLTPVDHMCAAAALKEKKPYIGVTMTTEHSTHLQTRIAQWVFEQMNTESNSPPGWYNAELSKAMQMVREDVPTPKAGGGTFPKGKRPAPGAAPGGLPKKAKPIPSALTAIQEALKAGQAEGEPEAGQPEE